MLWLVVLVLGTLGCLAADEIPCTVHDEQDRYYDLNPLKGSKDYEFKTPGGRLFAINICKSPVHETFGLKDDLKQADIGGFVRWDHGDFAIGALNTSVTIQDSHPRLTLSAGSTCKSKSGDNTHMRASTVVEFICDTAVFDNGKPRLVAQLPPGDDEEACAFFIEWRTHVACPTSEPTGSLGWLGVLIVTLISIILGYVVLGTLYNRFVLNLRGLDQIPQFSLESMRYHLWEGVEVFREWIYSLRGGGPRAGWSAIPRDPEENRNPLGRPGYARTGTNPISHQSQVLSGNESGFRDSTSDTVERGGRIESELDGGGGGGGFVRPQLPRTGSERRTDINPISHQAQPISPQQPSSPPRVRLTESSQQHTSHPPVAHTPSPPQPSTVFSTPNRQVTNTMQGLAPSSTSGQVPPLEKKRPKPIDLEGSAQEREFMLGEDEDEDENSNDTSRSENAAMMRGRHLGGDDGVIRL